MKRMIKIGLIILVTIHFCCRPGNQTKDTGNEVAVSPPTVADKTPGKSFENIVFASRYDTTCRMPLSAGVEDTLQLNGKIYGFCSKECKEEFVNKLKEKKK